MPLKWEPGRNPYVDHTEAAARRGDPRVLAEELLLVHPTPTREDQERLAALGNRLRQVTTLSEQRLPLPLRHPLAALRLLPNPGPEAAPLPEWEDLGLGTPGDAADLAADVVFDL